MGGGGGGGLPPPALASSPPPGGHDEVRSRIGCSKSTMLVSTDPSPYERLPVIFRNTLEFAVAANTQPAPLDMAPRLDGRNLWSPSLSTTPSEASSERPPVTLSDAIAALALAKTPMRPLSLRFGVSLPSASTVLM